MRDNRLLHVLGAGPWQLPTVRLAKQLGFRVLVTDLHSERPAYAVADFHEVVDITDREATLDAARRYEIGGILCDTTDVGVPTAAYVAEQLGLPGIGFETALNCTCKDRMRRLTEQAGMTGPQYRLVFAEQELCAVERELGFPLIVKPVDNQSGRGVRRVANTGELSAAFADARAFSRQGVVLVERWVTGTEIIVDGFIVDGAISILGVSHKTPTTANATIAARITYPGDLPAPTLARIEDTNRRTLRALGLASGVFHAEYLMQREAVVPIDIAARGGGCMIYTHVIPNISRVDANRKAIEQAMGRPVHIKAVNRGMAANVEFLLYPPGTIAAIDGAMEAANCPGVVGMHIGVGVGDVIAEPTKKDDRPGYLVTVGATAAEAVAASLAAKSRIQVTMMGNERPVAAL